MNILLHLFFRFCTRSLLHESFDYSLIDKIPGRQTDRKTLLGELNWIFTAVTDTIAWNVLPHGNARENFMWSSYTLILDIMINGYLAIANLNFRLVPAIVQARSFGCQPV